MRSKLALAGLVAGLAAALAPIAPASAQCDPQVFDLEGSGGCANGCEDFSRTYDSLAEQAHLPTGIWACTQ
ncbi:MAG TPA: hypothetical protein VFQ85_03500 [Mycobacteriales bacterium]|nr:hypothetical protein [Mycobacteriales bacterium]